MSTPLADERLVSHSGSPRRSQHLKELQLSTESTLSPSETHTSSNQDTESDNDSRRDNEVTQKVSPTDQKMITNFKGFNIDRSAYKHYGHQSLLNGQSLEKIISEAKVATRRKSVGASSEGDNSKEKGSNHNVSIRWDSSNRILIDQKISQILGIPPQAIEEESIWPYSAETLNEILRYKTEQEKTRQETIKNNFGETAIELLTLAKSMNISGDLIPFLFISNTTIEDLKTKINELKTDPSNVIHKISKLTKTPDHSHYQSSPPNGNGKRRYSEGRTLPSFSETAECLKSSVEVSPTRSPIKLPSISSKHNLERDDDNEIERERENSPSSQNERIVHLPMPNGSYLPHPPPPAHNNMYAMYYTPQGSGAPTQPQQKQEHTHDNTTSTATTVLGSPYSQKYHPVMYQQPQNYQTVSGPGYIQQQHPYPYYIASSPSNQPPSHPYVLHPSGAPPANIMQPVTTSQVSYRSPDAEIRRSHNVKHIHKDDEDSSSSHLHNKRHKPSTNAKSSSINFMITTPKNPPAKKYNNTHKDTSKNPK